MPPMKYADQYY